MSRSAACSPVLAVALLFAGCAKTPPRSEVPEPVKIQEVERADLPVVLRSGRPVVIDLTASWCPPCRPMRTQLEELAARRLDIDFVSLDYDKVKAAYDGMTPVERGTDPFHAAFAKLQSLPTLALYHHGRLVAIDENMRVLQDGSYTGNGHLLSRAESAALPKDDKGVVMQKGAPVNTASTIDRWIETSLAGTLRPETQRMPEPLKYAR